MGDRRFEAPYERVRDAADPVAAIAELADEQVVAALAAASRSHDPYLANVLATEASNRIRRAGRRGQLLGASLVGAAATALLVGIALDPRHWEGVVILESLVFLVVTLIALGIARAALADRRRAATGAPATRGRPGRGRNNP